MGSIECFLVDKERISWSSDILIQVKAPVYSACTHSLGPAPGSVLKLTRPTLWFLPRQQALSLGSTAPGAPSGTPFHLLISFQLPFGQRWGKVVGNTFHSIWTSLRGTFSSLKFISVFVCFSVLFFFTINFGGSLPFGGSLVCLLPPPPP